MDILNLLGKSSGLSTPLEEALRWALVDTWLSGLFPRADALQDQFFWWQVGKYEHADWEPLRGHWVVENGRAVLRELDAVVGAAEQRGEFVRAEISDIAGRGVIGLRPSDALIESLAPRDGGIAPRNMPGQNVVWTAAFVHGELREVLDDLIAAAAPLSGVKDGRRPRWNRIPPAGPVQRPANRERMQLLAAPVVLTRLYRPATESNEMQYGLLTNSGSGSEVSLLPLRERTEAAPALTVDITPWYTHSPNLVPKKLFAPKAKTVDVPRSALGEPIGCATRQSFLSTIEGLGDDSGVGIKLEKGWDQAFEPIVDQGLVDAELRNRVEREEVPGTLWHRSSAAALCAQLGEFQRSRVMYADLCTAHAVAASSKLVGRGEHVAGALQAAILAGDVDGQRALASQWTHSDHAGLTKYGIAINDGFAGVVLNHRGRVETACKVLGSISTDELRQQKCDVGVGTALPALLDGDSVTLGTALRALLAQHLEYVRTGSWRGDCGPAITGMVLLALAVQRRMELPHLPDELARPELTIQVRYTATWDNKPVRWHKATGRVDLCPVVL